MNFNFTERKELASILRENVLERFSKDFDRARGSDGDTITQSLYIQDASDMLKLCYLIQEGRHDEAREYCRDMDTFPRDQFYDMVVKQVGEELADQLI